VKSVNGGMTTPQTAVATVEHAEPAAVTRHPEDDEHTEEAFEATIVRLDGAAFEWLLRQLGK
jgi:hypothetical protein